MIEANAEQLGGDKAKMLQEKAAALMEDQNTESLACRTYERRERRDYANFKGTETTVKLFVSLPRVDSGIADLDEEESAWQINWVRILEPAPGQNIHTQDGTRIWFPTTFRDATMQRTLWITETAALQLANVSSPAEFQEAHKAGKLRFPFISSMKTSESGMLHIFLLQPSQSVLDSLMASTTHRKAFPERITMR